MSSDQATIIAGVIRNGQVTRDDTVRSTIPLEEYESRVAVLVVLPRGILGADMAALEAAEREISGALERELERKGAIEI